MDVLLDDEFGEGGEAESGCEADESAGQDVTEVMFADEDAADAH